MKRRTSEMGMTADGYKRRREEYRAEALRHHALLCYFFNKPVDPVTETVARLNEQLRAREVNQMKDEIKEINDGTSNP
jgi:hypothetical protein